MKPISLFVAPPVTHVASLPTALAPSGDGRVAIVLTLEIGGESVVTAVRVWDLATGTCTVRRLPPSLRGVVVLPGADALAAVGDDGAVRVDPRSGEVLGPLGRAEVGIPSPSGDPSVTSTDGLSLFDGTVLRWTLADRAFSRWVGIAWATSDRLVVASQFPKKTLSVVDARDGAILARHPTVAISEGFVLAPGGRRLVTGAVLIDVTDGTVLKRPLLKGASAVAFSPDAAVLAVADEDGRILVLGDDASRKLGAFDSGLASPQLAWLPDGSALVVADSVGSIGLWAAADIAPGVAIGRSPVELLTIASPLPAPPAPPPPEPPPRHEVEERGSIRIERTRPPPRLDRYRAEIEEVLGGPLPEEVARFYARQDGASYRALRDGTSLGLDETWLGLEAMFDGFLPHRQFRSAAAYERARDDLAGLALYGDTWSEDFDVDDRASLRHLNALMRSKQLIRIAGRSDALVIDFAPPAPKGGAAPPYRIALAHRGHEHHPLDLGFAEAVALFEAFGATSWYLAWLTPASIAEMNIDPVPTVEADLAPFEADFGEQVRAILERARRLSP